MDIETLREHCLSLPGTTEGIKWGDHLCFMLEEKIFMMCSLTAPHGFTVKVNTEQFEELAAKSGITQAPYMAKRHWIYVDSLNVFDEKELKMRISDSRALILAKLTKTLQAKWKA